MSHDPLEEATIPFLVDASAWVRIDRSSISAERWARALMHHRVGVCGPTAVEIMMVARDERELAGLEKEIDVLRYVPMTDTAVRAARTAVRELAARGAGRHRVAPVDALVAACAQEAGMGVLHYDHHYDRLAEVMSFESRWLAPPGALD